jgi:hypothetical protein
MKKQVPATAGQQQRISETAREYEVLLEQWRGRGADGATNRLHMLWMSRHIQSESRLWSLTESLRWMRLLQASMIVSGVLRVAEKRSPFEPRAETTGE